MILLRQRNFIDTNIFAGIFRFNLARIPDSFRWRQVQHKLTNKQDYSE